MLNFVVRCYRVPVRMGKIIRHAMRHHWHIGHHSAHVIYHGTIATMLVCVVVGVPALWLLPPSAQPEVIPPVAMIIPPTLIVPLPSDRASDSDYPPPFLPGVLFPPGDQLNAPQPSPLPPVASMWPHTQDTPMDRVLAVAEPASIAVFAVGILALLIVRRLR
jgi:hypothetical protein